MNIVKTKTVFLITLLLMPTLISSNAQASSKSDLCSQKEKQYNNKAAHTSFISCEQVDWDVKSLSGDYQPTNNGPMTAPPSEVKGYENKNPGIKNTQYFSGTAFYDDKTLKGLPLASKFTSAVNADPNKDQDLVDWLTNDWFKSMQPVPDAKPWSGKCYAWAAWSMNSDLQKLFSGIRNGMLCNGVPFTRGELKEIVTALYPEPGLQEKRFSKFFSGYVSVNPDRLEDANVALSKLGMFGQGEVGSDFKGPADVLTLAKTNMQNGKAMMMDRDPSNLETWNQPIQKITDVAYNDDSIKVWEALTSAEFSPASVKPAEQATQQAFLTSLIKAESDLTQNLLVGNGLENLQTDSNGQITAYTNTRLCDLRKQLDLKCDDLTGKIPMSVQVDILNRLKEAAYNKNIIQLKQEVSLVKHELIIEYMTENSFASDAPDKSVVQSYAYTAVHSRKPDGSDGDVIRSVWSPRVSTLSSICASPTLADGRNTTAMTKGFDASKKCSQGKVVDPTLQDREYFTGAVPPKSFKTFTPKPGFQDADTQKKKAYNKLLEFLGKCDHFDAAVDFLKHVDQATLDNQITEQEAKSLNSEYSSVKNLLEPSYIQSRLNNKSQGLQWLGASKSLLKL